MEHIESFSYASQYRYIHPNIKLFSSLIMLFTIVFCYNLVVSLIALVIAMIITLVVLKIPFSTYKRLVMVPMTFILISVLTIVIEIGTPQIGGVLIRPFNVFYVSQIGLIRGITIGVTALSAISIMYLFALTTPIIDLCSGLNTLKVPSSIISLMLIMYRLVFVLFTMSDTMRVAQTSRLGYNGFFTSVTSFGALISALFIRSFRKTRVMYDALEARGFQGEFVVLDLAYKTNYHMLWASVMMSITLIIIAIYSPFAI